MTSQPEHHSTTAMTDDAVVMEVSDSNGKSDPDDKARNLADSSTPADKKEKKHKKEKKDKSGKEKKDKKDKKEKKTKKDKTDASETESKRKAHSPEVDSDMEEARRQKLEASPAGKHAPETAETASAPSMPPVPETAETAPAPSMTPAVETPEPKVNPAKSVLNKEALAQIARATTCDLAERLMDRHDNAPTSESSTPATPAESATSRQTSDQQKVARNNHLNRYYRSIKSKSCPAEIKRLARDARAGKDSAALTDLLEEFFDCGGDWTRSKTMRTLSHVNRSRRQLKRVWKTRGELIQRYASEKDAESLAGALFEEKVKSKMWRPHPEFPDREEMRQVKVYDNEEELSESEDEMRVQTGVEASDDEEPFEDDEPVEPTQDGPVRKQPRGKAKAKAKAKARGTTGKRRLPKEENSPVDDKQLAERERKKVMKDISTYLSESSAWEGKLRDNGVNQNLMAALTGDINECVQKLRDHRSKLETKADIEGEDEMVAYLEKVKSDLTKHRNAIAAAKKHTAKPKTMA